MRVIYEVSAKTEAGRLDPSDPAMYSVQGRLSFEFDDFTPEGGVTPVPLALVLPRELWESVQPFDVLTFPLHPEIFRPALATAPDAVPGTGQVISLPLAEDSEVPPSVQVLEN